MVEKKTAGRPKKVAAPAAPISLPETDGEAPSADAYRLKLEDIDMSTCLGRKLAGGEDKRWKPVIYRESQCGGSVEDGCDLCKTCQRRLEKFVEAPKAGPWTGRVTEEPLAWVHMLGTEWAEEKKPRFSADGASVSDAASVASAPSTASSKKSAEEKESVKATKAAEKEAAKAAKEAEKAAAKAAKASAAAAEKEAKKAAAAAEKEAAKAAKEAEKAAKAAEKEAKKAASPPKKAVAPKKPSAPAKAATETEAADAAGELKLIDGTLYMVRAENVYEYDEISEKAGSFVGRLTADESIDTDAEEVAAE
jgi:flagellar biosynthesis GTPase FlhF